MGCCHLHRSSAAVHRSWWPVLKPEPPDRHRICPATLAEQRAFSLTAGREPPPYRAPSPSPDSSPYSPPLGPRWGSVGGHSLHSCLGGTLSAPMALLVSLGQKSSWGRRRSGVKGEDVSCCPCQTRAWVLGWGWREEQAWEGWPAPRRVLQRAACRGTQTGPRPTDWGPLARSLRRLCGEGTALISS